MRKIFEALDIKPVITVEKKRRTWNYKDYEIALDSITDLGDFVEGKPEVLLCEFLMVGDVAPQTQSRDESTSPPR